MQYLSLIALWVALGVPTLGQSIPRTSGTLLSGRAFVLPTDLVAKRTILIVGFSEKSASSSAAWGKETRTMIAANRSLGSFQLPVLASVPSMIRGIVVRSMKREVPPDLRGMFFPIFENETEWKQVVGFSAPEDAYVLLVDGSGSVLWKTHGGPTDERVAQLREAVTGR